MNEPNNNIEAPKKDTQEITIELIEALFDKKFAAFKKDLVTHSAVQAMISDTLNDYMPSKVVDKFLSDGFHTLQGLFEELSSKITDQNAMLQADIRTNAKAIEVLDKTDIKQRDQIATLAANNNMLSQNVPEILNVLKGNGDNAGLVGRMNMFRVELDGYNKETQQTLENVKALQLDINKMRAELLKIESRETARELERKQQIEARRARIDNIKSIAKEIAIKGGATAAGGGAIGTLIAALLELAGR